MKKSKRIILFGTALLAFFIIGKLTNVKELGAAEVTREVSTNKNELDILSEQKTGIQQSYNQTIAKDYRLAREADLLAEGWEVITKFEESTITLKNGETLGYFFGTLRTLGKEVTNESKENKIIPNANLLTDKERIGHLHLPETLPTTAGVFISEGMDVVTPNLVWLDHGYYRKINPITGLVEYKLIFTPDGLYKDNNPEVLRDGVFTIESTMEGVAAKQAVLVTQNVTNLSSKTYNQFVFGQDLDTHLRNDKVNIYLSGYQRGLYIESGGYRLDYDFTPAKAPDNWLGTNYNGWALGYHFKIEGVYVKAWGGFDGFTGIGNETDKGEAGTVIVKGVDSAIHMKNQPVVFQHGDQNTYSYYIKINRLSKVVIDLDKQTDIHDPNKDYKLTGTWNDIGADKMDLYYQIDDGERVKFASNLPNTVKGEKYPFEVAIPNEKLTSGEHTITIVGVNDDDIDGTAKMSLTVNSAIKINYLDEAKNEIREADFEYGLVDQTYRWKILDLKPEYEFIEVENSDIDGEYVVGKFKKELKEINYIYKEIPKTVNMTVKFVRKDGTAVENILDGTTIKDQIVPDMLIGSTFNPLDYKKEISGFEYEGFEDTSNGLVPSDDYSISIFYKGVLDVIEVPAAIDFGTHHLITAGTRNIHPEKPMTVDILDTRKSVVDWKLMLALEGGKLTNANGDDYQGEVWFKGKGKSDEVITSQGKPIHLREKNIIGKESVTWDNQTEGIYLKQFSGNTKDIYSGKLLWTVTDAP